jgi:hypothetical protein
LVIDILVGFLEIVLKRFILGDRSEMKGGIDIYWRLSEEEL